MVHVNTEHDLAPIVPICEEIKKKPAADYDPCRFQLNVFEMASGVVSHKNVTKVVGCIYVQLGSLNDSMSMVSGVRCQAEHRGFRNRVGHDSTERVAGRGRRKQKIARF